MLTLPNHPRRLAVARLLLGSLVAATPWLASPASAQMLPWGWSMADIGGPSSSGGANFGPGSIAVSSGGTGINGTSDQFTLLYRTLAGNGTLIARVAALQSADPLSQGGLMIRESLAPGARHVAVLVTPGGTVFRSRVSDGANTQSVAGAAVAAGAGAVWLKLDRLSNVFIASQSFDGVTWQFVGSAPVPLSPTAFVGLAVASHKSGAMATANVTNVSVIGNGVLPAGWSGNDIGTPAITGGSTSGGTNFLLDSAGTGIAGGGDQFRYVYQQRSGDVDVVARVAGFDVTTPGALAGIMMRQSMAGISAHAAMLVSPGNGTVMRSRGSNGALTASVSSPGAAPVWVKLSRRGSIVITARSVDGSTWTTVGQQNVPMTDPYYVGMALTSGDSGQRARATFDGVTMTRPNQAPTVTLTAPASTLTLLAPASLTLTADASDPDGTVAQVDFFAGPTLLGSDTASPYAFNWSNVKAGAYVIKAVARDNLGAYTSSIERAVTVTGNAPPTVALTAPAALTFASGATVGMAAAASDLDGTVARVDFYAGAALLGSDTTSPYDYSWVRPPNGTHVLKAVAIDNGGGSANSITRTISVGVAPVSPPTVSLTSPAAGATVAPLSSVTITATATDSDGSVARVDFYAGITLIGTQRAAPYSITWAVPAGSHVLKAVAFDDTGVSATSATRTITAEAPARPPTVSLTSPDAGATVAPAATVTITASATDADGSVSRVDFYAGAALIGTQRSAPYGITWTVPAGSHVLKAVAFDNTGASTHSATRTITAAQNGSPAVTLTSPANGQVLTAPASVTLTATASDTDGTVSKVEFYVGATLVGSDTTSPYSFTWSNVAVGDHGITAVARDNTGNMTVSSARDITVVAGGLPNTVAFIPSAEHDLVDRYVLEVFAAGGTPGVSPAMATRNLGRPPVVSGECVADVAATISGLPAGSYIATVSSENNLGSGRSQWTFFSR